MTNLWKRADLDEAAFRGDELADLPEAVRRTLKHEQILTRREDLRTAECDACGAPHLEEVDIITDSPDGDVRAYLFCPAAGRVAVPLNRLQVWAIDLERLVRTVGQAIALPNPPTDLLAHRVWTLGQLPVGDRVIDVFLVRGANWPDGSRLLQDCPRLVSSRNAVVLCLDRLPRNSNWYSTGRVLASLAEFEWPEGAQSQLRTQLIQYIRSQGVPDLQPERVFQRQGDIWNIRFAGTTIQMKHRLGLQYILYLLGSPGRETSATDLIGAASGRPEASVRSSAGEIVDDTGMAAYVRRAEELQGELDHAIECANSEEAESIRTEMEAVATQIASAKGLGGRKRVAGDTLDKARKSTSDAIASALKMIERSHPDLGKFLDKRISKGAFLSYTGDDISWTF